MHKTDSSVLALKPMCVCVCMCISVIVLETVPVARLAECITRGNMGWEKYPIYLKKWFTGKKKTLLGGEFPIDFASI